MPRGPSGEKRPTDVIGNAGHVMRWARLPPGEPSPLRQRHAARRRGIYRCRRAYLVELQDLARARGVEPQELFQGAQIGPFHVLAP